MKLAQTSLVQAIGLPPRSISEIVLGKRAIGDKLKAIRPRAA